MATMQKFYHHAATTTNTGTMPSNSPTTIAGGVLGAGTEATGNTTARAMNDTIGSGQVSSVCTAAATSGATQRLGHRRFVSPPLAARTFAGADGNWTWSMARQESNTNHNGTGGQPFESYVYIWRPSSGTQVGTARVNITSNALGGTTEATSSTTAAWSGTQAILDGDIIVHDIYTLFTQSMATAYTDTYWYDGTTEASTTNCASFLNAPSALTLYTPVVARQPRSAGVNFQDPGVFMEGDIDKRNHLWLPKRKIWRPRTHIPTPATI